MGFFTLKTLQNRHSVSSPCSLRRPNSTLCSFPDNQGFRALTVAIKRVIGASLVAQWLGICLPMQGTRVRALVWEDPMPRSNWAREPQLLSLRIWSLCSATREAAVVRGPRIAMKRGPRLPQLEKALAQKRRPNTAINK